MLEELQSAVSYYHAFLHRHYPHAQPVLPAFAEALLNELVRRYKPHWNPSQPEQGSGYRCIRLMRSRLDPAFVCAARQSGLSVNSLLKWLLPLCEQPMFINPGSVQLHAHKNQILSLYHREEPLHSPPASPAQAAMEAMLSENSQSFSENASETGLSRPESPDLSCEPSTLIALHTLNSILDRVVTVQ